MVAGPSLPLVYNPLLFRQKRTIMKAPHFYIDNIPIHNDVILAPMAGFSDMPYRAICRELGSAMSYTEFVSTEAIVRDNQKTLRMLHYDPAERPVVFQIFGADPPTILEAAKRLQDLQPDIIDLNMGCSVKKVSGKGAGAALLKSPFKIGRIFNLLSKELTVPVTGKIRLGWDVESLNFRDVVHAMQDNGARLVAVHGRTKKQAYKGQANWPAIAEIKNFAQIPVIGNGDVSCVADITRMKNETGCDAVMIARAAIGNPWIFARKDAHQVTLGEKLRMIRRHLTANLDFYDGDYGLILFRKHVVKYINAVHGAREMRGKLVTARTVAEFESIVTEAESRLAMAQLED